MIKKSLGYVEELDLLGLVTSLNLLTQEVTILTNSEDGEETKTISLEENKVLFMEELFTLGDAVIFENDILVFKEDILKEFSDEKVFYKIVKDGENVKLLIVSEDDLETIKEHGEGFSPNDSKTIESLNGVLDLVGNFYEIVLSEEEEDVNLALKSTSSLDFNVQILKTDKGFFYACNNKENEEVDLIKVLFLGASLLEEEKYSRKTISHELFLKYVEDGKFEESSPYELQKFVSSKLNESCVEDDLEDEEFEEPTESEEKCECGKKSKSNCYCDLW